MLVSVKSLGLEAEQTPILVLRWRMSGAIPLLPLCVHGVHTGNSLYLLVHIENIHMRRMFMSEVNAIGFKELRNRLDWFSKFWSSCCWYDMAFKAVVLDFLCRPISWYRNQRFPKLDSISVFFWRKFLLWWTARWIHPHDVRPAVQWFRRASVCYSLFTVWRNRATFQNAVIFYVWGDNNNNNNNDNVTIAIS
jgi:hypothetical protein